MNELVEVNKLAIGRCLWTTEEDFFGLKDYIMKIIADEMETFGRVRSLWYANPKHPLNFVRLVIRQPSNTSLKFEVKLW